MAADHEDLQGSEASDIQAKRFKSQGVFVQTDYGFLCENGTLTLTSRPRPSSTAEGHFVQEDDVEIEEGDRKGSKTEDSWSMSENLYRKPRNCGEE